ncbi:MAG: rolling circle replication-associated protein [Actinomycetota bacterium]
MRCRSTRASVCSPCATSHRHRVRLIARSGIFVVGRGEVFMLTLTAPGAEQHEDTVHGGICLCTPKGGIDLSLFNATLPIRWNRFAQALRRDTGLHFHYFKAIEVQERGALHLHVLIACPDASALWVIAHETLRGLAMEFGFGHSIRRDTVTSARGAASYVAKYVSKASDQRPHVPWLDTKTGLPTRARYRAWSCSRHWGLRMSDVVAAQCAWARQQAPSLDSNSEIYTSPSPIDAAFARMWSQLASSTGPPDG